jgi:hypothetical protein
MSKKHYCPACKGELEMLSGCGAVGYFCNHCRKLVSRSKMLSEEDLREAGEGPEEAAPDQKNDPMA